MNENEVRVGNYISYIDDATGGQPVEFNVRDFDVFYKIAPIPLTEEWLLRFGFGEGTVKSKEGLELHKIAWNKNNVIIQRFTIYPKQEYRVRLSENWFIKIEYVHTFQNLYFALTGEEL